jgi:hypothetical protein
MPTNPFPISVNKRVARADEATTGRNGPLGVAGAHDQADRDARNYAVPLGASGRGAVRRRQRQWNNPPPRSFSSRLQEREMSRVSAVCAIAVVASLIGSPLSFAQSGGGGSAGGGSAGTGSAAGSPPAGSAGAGTAGVSGVPVGPGSASGTNNSVNDPSGAGNAAKAPQTPGTNSAGTANSTGSPGAGSTPGRVGSTSTRAARGTAATGPNTKADTKTEAAVDAENRKLDRMIKGICRGC